MNCHDIDRLLISGQTDPLAWPAEARAHLESCARCQALLGLSSEEPRTDFAAAAPTSVAQVVLSDLRPVTPLAGDITLTAIVIAAVLAAMALLLAVVGAKGFPVMSDFQRAAFGIVLCGMLLVAAIGYAKRLVPGSLIVIPIRQALAFFSVLFAGLVLWQFHRSYDIPMAKANLGCYEIGLLGAGLTFLVGWLSGKRGFWNGNRFAVEALCVLSAAASLFMLTIHCPLQNARHVFIGHGGAFLTALAAGLAVRFFWARGRSTK
ncbi:MAG TPA: hypothetical protein VH325_10735 [Bryobacteraceae bacterium]|jgi:hypothetical protein|nr:hypothetical protein [Bryobacteraceae bacterium]